MEQQAIKRRKSEDVELRKVEHQIEVEDREFNNLWRCCSGSVIDQRATRFFTQLLISLVVITVCVYQLVSLDNCEAQSLYSGLLTMVIGVWLPSPNLSK